MKKLKIKNPIIRTIAGAPFFLIIVAVVLSLISLVLYGVGKLTVDYIGYNELFNYMTDSEGKADDFFTFLFVGFVVIFAIFVIFFIGRIFLEESRSVGNRLFNNTAVKESKT